METHKAIEELITIFDPLTLLRVPIVKSQMVESLHPTIVIARDLEFVTA
jgi:hypothetical protein